MSRKYTPDPDDKRLWLSHSQLDTYKLCPRKWWFSKRCKLPQKKSRSTLKGSVAHECLERYLEGQDNVYPDKWYVTDEGTLSAAEQAEVCDAVNKAIKDGLVERHDGQLIERRIEYPLSGDIWMQGYIDLLDVGNRPEDWQITDHKTSSSTRYLENERSLASNVQLARYGHAVEQMARDEFGVELGDIPVRHNQLVWNGPVRKRTAKISRATRQAIHEETIQLAEALEETYTTCSTDPEDWKDIQGPETGSGACQAYGGCSFENICAHRCTVKEYIAMRTGSAEPQSDQDDWDSLGALIDPKTDPDMSEFDSPSAEQAKPRKFRRVTNPGSTATTTPSSPAPEGTKPKIEASPAQLTNQALVDAGVVDAERAPWGYESDGEDVCSDCDGYGYFLDAMTINGKKRKKGEECPKCRLLSSMGRRKADINDYIVTANTETGLLEWVLKDQEPEPEPEPEAEPEVQDEPEVVEDDQDDEDDQDEYDEEDEPAAKKTRRKAGRRKTTGIHYGVTPTMVIGKYKTDVNITQEVIEAMGGSQFYSRPLYDQENDVKRYAYDNAHEFTGTHYFLSPSCSAISIWFCEGLISSGEVTQITNGLQVRPK